MITEILNILLHHHRNYSIWIRQYIAPEALHCANSPPSNQKSAPVSEATENIYASLHSNNSDIDLHIATLKAALTREGLKEAVFDPARLVQSNRSGRKLMQAYFRQRGVSVTFSAE